MTMISVNDFKNGLTIQYNNDIWRIVEFQHVKPGKGGAFVRSKLKSLKTGAVQDYTFRSTAKVEMQMSRLRLCNICIMMVLVLYLWIWQHMSN